MINKMKSLVTKRDKRQGEKISYQREKIDDRQANKIPLPFVCKMRYIPRVHRILQTNGSGIVFACLSQLNFFTLAFIAFCEQTLQIDSKIY